MIRIVHFELRVNCPRISIKKILRRVRIQPNNEPI